MIVECTAKNVQKSVPVKAAVGRNASRLTSVHSNIPVTNEQLIQIELQKLLKEKERLQREQEDNTRRVNAIKHSSL